MKKSAAKPRLFYGFASLSESWALSVLFHTLRILQVFIWQSAFWKRARLLNFDTTKGSALTVGPEKSTKPRESRPKAKVTALRDSLLAKESRQIVFGALSWVGHGNRWQLCGEGLRLWGPLPESVRDWLVMSVTGIIRYAIVRAIVHRECAYMSPYPEVGSVG